MAKRKRRECEDCIAYINPLPNDDGNKCGLGFEVIEDLERPNGMIAIVPHPFENSCDSIETLPSTKEEFVEMAAQQGITWDIENVMDEADLDYW